MVDLQPVQSNTGLCRAVDSVTLLPGLAEEASTLESRQRIREVIYDLLESDGAADSMAVVRCDDTSYSAVQAEEQRLDERLLEPFALDDPRPVYQLSLVERRVRKRAFRSRVLAAYERACALCGVRIRWGELIEAEAAHITHQAS